MYRSQVFMDWRKMPLHVPHAPLLCLNSSWLGDVNIIKVSPSHYILFCCSLESWWHRFGQCVCVYLYLCLNYNWYLCVLVFFFSPKPDILLVFIWWHHAGRCVTSVTDRCICDASITTFVTKIYISNNFRLNSDCQWHYWITLVLVMIMVMMIMMTTMKMMMMIMTTLTMSAAAAHYWLMTPLG